ncbi:restriction endonuclease [Halobacteriales archaeon QS_9_68_42]|nr:MAG: restriction endonuclease [Halobacteriales archaeon QS_9_68_42]
MSQATLPERPYVNSNLFSGHYLDERVRGREEWECDDDAGDAMEELRSLYELEGSLVDGYGEDALVDNWIDEVLDVLGFGTQKEVTIPDGGGFVDELLFETTTARRDAAKVYLDTGDTTDLFERGVGIVEAKQWDAAFDVQFSEQRPYRNASHQTKHYLEKTPANIQWGILTNGRKWRLYGTNDYETQTYYEVDLPELLERGDLEAFKYFYVFFRSEAFRESAGTTFLDEVWSESETVSQELGENLQDNVFTALRVLGHGFVETNDDLDIDPNDEEALDELKEQSLVLLYRLMFVLYAEARGLIHPEGQRAQDDYEENFSLDALRLDIHEEIGEVDDGFAEEFSTYSTGMWSRLEDLFRLIDEGEEDLGIPPYNGGLFDHDEHNFLTEHEVSNRYLAEVIYRLSTTQNDEDRYVLADYADLDTRHLGSVYEGLLEHQFRIAPEQYAAVAEDDGQVWKPVTAVSVAEAVETVPEGGLYVVNDEGERKATGAYYTPDYVVTYIVEETVGPLVEEIREDLVDQGFEPGTQEYIGPFFRRVTDLRILDPAMGSGHFLTKATGYLSEQVMAEVREAEEEFGVAFDEQHIRREIAKECIYGVDLNGMAVELAKLSMWLETLAADRPLAFLDHHFKQGNSLVGSDIEAIEELESDADGDGDQYSLAEFGATREGTIERLMDIYSEFLAIENETVEDVREMKRKYAEIEQDELRRRLVAMANVHTAEGFGLDVPGGAYERMAKTLEDDDEWAALKDTDWFNTAQRTANEQNFFHWKLAFPEAFYEQEGTTREDAGFDAVIGNPPYVKIQNLRQSAPEFADYATQEYETASGRFDIYALFVERGVSLTNSGRLSYILPNKFFESGAGQSLRDFLASNQLLQGIADFGRYQVFEGVTTYTCILTLTAGNQQFSYSEVEQASQNGLANAPRVKIGIDELDDGKWALMGPRERQVLNKLREFGASIGDRSQYLSEGIVSGDNDVMFVDILSRDGETVEVRCPVDGNQYTLESELVKPLLRGDYIERFGSLDSTVGVIYPYEIVGGESRLIPEQKLESNFPETYSYLSEFESRLRERGSENMEYPAWYALWCPREKQLFEAQKLIVPDVCQRSEFTLDDIGIYIADTAYGIVPTRNEQRHLEYLLAVMNSTLTWFFIYHTSPVLRGDFRRFKTSYLSPLPVPDASPEAEREAAPTFEESVQTDEKSLGERLSDLAHVALGLHKEREAINVEPLDYIQLYSDGPALTDIGIYQPPEGVGDTKLAATKEDYENIRVGTVICDRKGENTVVIHATARYKPDDPDAHETDQWGYTETEPMPAMRLSDLSETEADLVEAFVPVAVEEAGGFAGFRETATKTNSLVDRLEAITLPDPDDVADDLQRYREAVERAEELDEKIRRTDDLIDEIVYDLYGLTDEEIEIVEEAVGK